MKRKEEKDKNMTTSVKRIVADGELRGSYTLSQLVAGLVPVSEEFPLVSILDKVVKDNPAPESWPRVTGECLVIKNGGTVTTIEREIFSWVITTVGKPEEALEQHFLEMGTSVIRSSRAKFVFDGTLAKLFELLNKWGFIKVSLLTMPCESGEKTE